MPEILIEFTFLLILIALNAIFAMSEIAVVSARTIRLQQMADNGNRGAATALEMARNPNRFLSTVQVGITLVSIFAGAFGGARMASELAEWLVVVPIIGRYADTMSLALIIGGITFLSVVLGELVPKRIALQYAEGIAAFIARPMHMVALVTAPVVRLLSLTTNGVLRLIRMQETVDLSASEEDIWGLAKQSAQAGMIEEAEQEMVEGVFRLGDRTLGGMMTPRVEIVWLDTNAPEEEIRRTLRETDHTRLPVCDAEIDRVMGVAHAKDLLSHYVADGQLHLQEIMREPLFAPESMPALKALEKFKSSGLHMALVVDEYGGIEGVVTLIDILEAIVGDIPTPEELEDPPIVQREDGSWLVEGLLPIADYQNTFDVPAMPGEGNYYTLGGFVIYMLGEVPKAGSRFEWNGNWYEVADMDGKRVDKVLITLIPNGKDADQHGD